MSPIVLATANPHKVSELRAIFDAHDIPVVGLSDLPQPPGGFREPTESGTTFEENATIKALAYAARTGRVCLADDSGLEIDALQGRPGVISSHYSTDGRECGLSRADRDRQNNDRVLRELARVPPDRRAARFVCVMALAGPGDRKPLALVRATFEGRVGLPASELLAASGNLAVPRGEHGFGYDPLFLVAPEYSRTGAELTTDEKNRRSHRAAAANLMTAEIQRLADALA